MLLALLALLHASFSPGSSHLAAIDLDGCRTHLVGVDPHRCHAAAPAVVTALDSGDHHQDGDASRPCDASGHGPRRLADLSHPLAASVTPSDTSVIPTRGGVTPAASGASATGPAFGPDIQRC
ncbi:hypothetical protein ACIRBZ_19145 [Streptomyces sp. NPDC094038]|uniref:hypothetical protein n=1 Tax=Streptomyces sp. NPDC094038 TaxID=3366055 RepID=UPI00380F4249